MECRELFLINIYMLYSFFSDYMLRAWGRFDPPVKVGGCGRAFWTTPTLPKIPCSDVDVVWTLWTLRLSRRCKVSIKNTHHFTLHRRNLPIKKRPRGGAHDCAGYDVDVVEWTGPSEGVNPIGLDGPERP